MIEGAHSIIHSSDPDADRAFFRDVLALPDVDVGWLANLWAPATEVAFHPAEASGKHELYLMVRDIEEFVGRMGALGVPCTAIHDERWVASSISPSQEAERWACTSHATLVRLLCQPPNQQLQRAVKDKLPSYTTQHAADEPGRSAMNMRCAQQLSETPNVSPFSARRFG